MNNVSLVLPRFVKCGAGDIATLPDVLDQLNAKRILLVHGPTVAAAGILDEVRATISERIVAVFSDSRSPTDVETKEAAFAIARESQPDAVVAVGGGSAIDAGKCAVWALGTQTPFVAVPTTFSGAENTLDCGVVDPVKKTKDVLRGPHLVATAAVYDPHFIRSMSADVVAGSAMNALAHCVEALYTPATNRFIQSIALGGARQLVDGLKLRFDDRRIDQALGLLLEGSISAGIACGNASIALHHVICHYVGPSLGIPHGTANAIMLPHAMRFNAPAVEPLFSELAVTLRSGDQADDAVGAIASLNRRLGLPYRLGPLGLNDEIVEAITEHVVNHPRLANNPRTVTREDVAGILWAAA